MKLLKSLLERHAHLPFDIGSIVFFRVEHEFGGEKLTRLEMLAAHNPPEFSPEGKANRHKYRLWGWPTSTKESGIRQRQRKVSRFWVQFQRMRSSLHINKRREGDGYLPYPENYAKCGQKLGLPSNFIEHFVFRINIPGPLHCNSPVLKLWWLV